MVSVGFNHVTVMGNVSAGPWERTPPDGSPHVAFRIEIPEASSKPGEVFRTFVPVMCFGRTMASASALAVGDPIIVMGRLSWQRSAKESKGQLVITGWKITNLADDAPKSVE